MPMLAVVFFTTSAESRLHSNTQIALQQFFTTAYQVQQHIKAKCSLACQLYSTNPQLCTSQPSPYRALPSTTLCIHHTQEHAGFLQCIPWQLQITPACSVNLGHCCYCAHISTLSAFDSVGGQQSCCCHDFILCKINSAVF